MANLPSLSGLQIIGAKGAGGAESFYVKFVQALSKVSDVHCVVRQKSWVESQLQETNIPLYSLPFAGVFDFKTKFKIKNLAGNIKPDYAQVWMSRAGQKMPLIDVPTIGRLGGYYKLKNYNTCNALVGNTQDICDYIVREGWSKNAVRYMPNFPHTPEQGWEKNRENIRQKLGVKGGQKLLLMTGRLHAVKGVDVALKALERLGDDYHLALLGAGPLEAELKTLAQTLRVNSRTHFMGWQNNVSPYAAACDVWLAPSRYEPLGNIVLDAWAHQRPVVAAKSKGPMSLIQHQKTGLLFEIDDDYGLQSAIEESVDNPKSTAQMVSNAYKYLHNTFGEDKVIADYMEFYKSLCVA